MPEYAKDNFMPGIAMFFAFMLLLSGFVGVIPVWVMIGSSLLGVLMLAFAEEHKALFARLLYQFTENWVNCPKLDPEKTMIFHATNDVVILKERRFTGPRKCTIRELDGTHNLSFDGTNMLSHDFRLKSLVKTYEQVMNNMRRRKTPT